MTENTGIFVQPTDVWQIFSNGWKPSWIDHDNWNSLQYINNDNIENVSNDLRIA